MFSIETRINGMLISYAHVTKEYPLSEESPDDKDKLWAYKVNYVEVKDKNGKSRSHEFTVIHNRDDEATGLVMKVYEGLKNIKKKEKS